MRRHLLLIAVLAPALACTIAAPDDGLGFGTDAGDDDHGGADEGSTGQNPDLDPDPVDPDEPGGSTGGDDPDPSGGSTGGVDPGDGGSSGGGSTGGGSTGGDPGGSTGGDPTTEQPDDGAWSHCVATSDCNDADLGCLNNGGAMAPDDGVCTMVCAADDDPSGCPALPGAITATLGCVVVNTTPVCALMCQADLDCPGGMKCLDEASDNGTVSVCM